MGKSSTSDPAHNPGQGSPENQEIGSRKRPRWSKTASVPTPGPSGVVPKRKRDSTHEGQTLPSPSYEELHDEVPMMTPSKKMRTETPEGESPE